MKFRESGKKCFSAENHVSVLDQSVETSVNTLDAVNSDTNRDKSESGVSNTFRLIQPNDFVSTHSRLLTLRNVQSKTLKIMSPVSMRQHLLSNLSSFTQDCNSSQIKRGGGVASDITSTLLLSSEKSGESEDLVSTIKAYNINRILSQTNKPSSEVYKEILNLSKLEPEFILTNVTDSNGDTDSIKSETKCINEQMHTMDKTSSQLHEIMLSQELLMRKVTMRLKQAESRRSLLTEMRAQIENDLLDLDKRECELREQVNSLRYAIHRDSAQLERLAIAREELNCCIDQIAK